MIPKLRKRSQPVGDSVALAEAAKMLVAAENPVIIAGRVQRTDAGPKLLAQLAETLQAPVVDDRARMSMANRHPLNHTERGNAAIRAADVILALEPLRSLRHAERGQRSHRPSVGVENPAGHQGHRARHHRHADQAEHHALCALHLGRSRHHRRCGSDDAAPHPGDREGSHAEPPHRHGDARRQARSSRAPAS